MEAEEDRLNEEALQKSRNRLRRRTQWIDAPQPPISPRISIRGIPLEIVACFKYLGLHDTEDGTIENAVRARVVRMEYRFKQFQGRVLTNHKISVLPLMNVFKTIVMTNGLYACETWNYTTTDIARLERHYFRLLRDTLLLPKNNPDITFTRVLDVAEEQGICTVLPMECLIQRQQLKFLGKLPTSKILQYRK